MNKILTKQQQERITNISGELCSIHDLYKNEIESIVQNNYGKKKDEELFALFKNLGFCLSNRNNEILNLLKEKYGLNFKEELDISGGFRINDNLVDDGTPNNIKSFFDKDYTRKKDGKIYSRGYGYYFNFPGLKVEKGNYVLDVKEFLKNISKYYEDVKSYLGEFEGKKTSQLDSKEKKLLSIGLEHYKNILFYLQNFLTSVFNKKYLTKSILNISDKNFSYLFVDINNREILPEINNLLKKEIEYIVSYFGDIILGIDNNKEFNYNPNISFSKLIDVMENLYQGSFDKQKVYIERLEKKSNSGKQSNLYAENKLINKSNNKLIGKLSRTIREEDNPVKQLLSCHNISQSIAKETKLIDSIGILYGGIEIPYIMKYVLTRFGNRDSGDINVKLLNLSEYNNRNLKQTSTIGNYDPTGSFDISKNNEARLQLILDDNAYIGTTLQVASNIGASKGPVYSGVSEVGLRRGVIGNLAQGSNISFLLSKVADSSSVTPIRKNKGNYLNMVNAYIIKNLPGFVGKL